MSRQNRNTWPLGAVTPQCVRALLSRPSPRSSCRNDYSALAHELVQPSCPGLGTRREWQATKSPQYHIKTTAELCCRFGAFAVGLRGRKYPRRNCWRR